MSAHLRAAWRERISREGMGAVTDFLDGWAQLYSMRPEMGGEGKYPSLAALVRDVGKQFHVDRDMAEEEWEGIPRGPMGLCFENALLAAFKNPALTYVEGYAQGSVIPLHHAWVTDDGKRAIDVTWERGHGQDYFGVPMKTEWVARTVTRSGYYGVFGDLTMDMKWLDKGFPASAIERV